MRDSRQAVGGGDGVYDAPLTTHREAEGGTESITIPTLELELVFRMAVPEEDFAIILRLSRVGASETKPCLEWSRLLEHTEQQWALLLMVLLVLASAYSVDTSTYPCSPNFEGRPKKRPSPKKWLIGSLWCLCGGGGWGASQCDWLV